LWPEEVTTRDHQTIDLVAHHEATDTVLLVMVEDRPWGNRGALLPDLEEKLNTYLSYALDGGLAEDYPDYVGKPIRIELRALHPPGEREEEFLEIVRERHLSPVGIALRWSLIKNMQA
jgi:hypothetical protein